MAEEGSRFEEVLAGLPQVRLMQETSDELRQKAYILAKENMKIREEYLLKENVSSLLARYSELQARHDALLEEQKSSVGGAE